MTVQQVDGLGHHLHVAQLLGGDVEEQVLDLRVLNAEALGEILHGGFQLAVAAAQLLLEQRCVLGVRLLNFHRMKQHFFVLKHKTGHSFGWICH